MVRSIKRSKAMAASFAVVRASSRMSPFRIRVGLGVGDSFPLMRYLKHSTSFSITGLGWVGAVSLLAVCRLVRRLFSAPKWVSERQT